MLGAIKAAATASNPWLALLRLLWPYLLALAVLALAVWRIYAWGYDNAKADDAKERGELVSARDTAIRDRQTAINANANLAASEQAARNANAQLVAENVRLAGEGAAKVQQAEADRAKAQQTLAQWRAELENRSKQAGCAQAKSAFALAATNYGRACRIRDY